MLSLMGNIWGFQWEVKHCPENKLLLLVAWTGCSSVLSGGKLAIKNAPQPNPHLHFRVANHRFLKFLLKSESLYCFCT